ncbi:hypothetical protein ACKFKG_28390 [Phormidesmis sp. 146-35]
MVNTRTHLIHPFVQQRLFQQQRLMFFPLRDYPHTPNLYKLNYQDVWLLITTKPGKVDRLHGWWIPAEKTNAPVMLYFHHNAVNIGANVSQARQFHKLATQFC